MAVTQGVKTLLRDCNLTRPGARIDDLHLSLSDYGEVLIDELDQPKPRFLGDTPHSHVSMSLYYVKDCGTEDVSDGAVDDGKLDEPIRYGDWHRLKPKSHIGPNGLEFAAQMLQQCHNSHPGCRLIQDAFVPKRLIDVECSAHRTGDIRLIDDAESTLGKGNVEYAALSYCWGEETTQKINLLRRTNESISDMANGIDSSTLPAVFADAVSTTKHLGLRYLWIDAICIAQGNPIEWAIESTKMAQIYSHAVVTIAAAASESANQSLLDTWRYRKWRSGIEVKASDGCGLAFAPKIFVRWDWATLYENGSLFGFPSKEVSAMNSRAWVMQEALLSQRLLTFEHARVVFTCLKGRLLKDSDGEYRNSAVRTCNFEWWSPVRRVGDGTLGLQDCQNVWVNAVEEYSARRLTDYNDRLPAIAGIASMVKSKCVSKANCEYLAGLWKHSFVQELRWYRNSSDDRYVRCGRLQAPSWSWASVPWKVECPFGFMGLRVETELRSWSLTREFGEFGRVGAGLVALEGPHMEATLEFGESEPTLAIPSNHISPFKLGPAYEGGESLVIWDFPTEAMDLCKDSIEAASKNTDGSRSNRGVVYLLRLATRNHDQLQSWYLVLKKKDDILGLYSRIGLWAANCYFEEHTERFAELKMTRESVLKEFDTVQGTWPRKNFVVM
ncbi:hypothetical protein H2200_011584 [Cladophialophora chaetospira]|uniref:Heterokaryon incompatibility domain-containing protein n=1 Tax=Cladophialophora chaetospira TaxID=386627 RepID=A0AA38WZK5_9EURO|nr:hypothetical protein H2200_011584 [Cladophialophora chaetospira]